MTGTVTCLFTHKSVPVIFEPPCIYVVRQLRVKGVKTWEVRGCCIGASGRMRSWFVCLFDRTLRIGFSNFLKVCTCHSESTVSPISKNSTNKTPSPSQKTLAVISPTEVCTFGLFSLVSAYSTRFSSPRFHSFWPPEECPPRKPFWLGRRLPARTSVTSSDASAKSFIRPAYSVSQTSEKLCW